MKYYFIKISFHYFIISYIYEIMTAFVLMRRNVGSNEQGEYCRAALQRSDRKEPRYKWPTLLYFTLLLS